MVGRSVAVVIHQELDRGASAAPRLSERLSDLVGRGMRSSLEGARRALEALGRPDGMYQVLLVGGSNGKGTTSFLAAEALRAQGLRVGLLTSPHLVDPRERILVGDDAGWGMPDEDDLLDDLATVLDALPDATYFEATTLAGFLHLSRAGVAAAVVEVGLGGRLDATNAADPQVSAVVRIDLEHTAILGKTRGEIAAEKGAIARAGRPFFSSTTARQVLGPTIRAAGTTITTPPPFVGRLSLEGAHARENAGIALAAAEALARGGGHAWNGSIARTAIARAKWPGRIDRFFARGVPWILDGAHNPAASEALAAALHHPAASGGGEERDERVVLLAGFLRDKDASSFLDALAPHAIATVLTTVPEAGSRAASPPQWEGAERIPDAAFALGRATALARARDVPVLVTGSIYLVGWALGVLRGAPFPVRPPL